MKSTPEAHRSHPWKVHAIVADFEVIDVWHFTLKGAEGGFGRFLELFWTEIRAEERRVLSKLRLAIGKVAGWDEKPHSLPIPGCSEKSVGERLSPDMRSSDGLGAEEPPLPKSGSMRLVYRFSNEALYEASNGTVHALLHLGFAGGDAELAVYIKSRGAFTRFYMAAIWPFRHFYIYPRLIAGVEHQWRQAAAGAVAPQAEFHSPRA